ncbi:MAG: hypothetical protein WHV67_01930 [Thermoanaerobaculia bacterium]
MKKILFLFYLIFSIGIFAQWQKQGVVSGTINDMKQMHNASSSYLATAGGFFYFDPFGGPSFYDYSNNLPAGPVLKFDEVRVVDQSNEYWYFAALLESGVYVWNPNLGLWIWADEYGLMDSVGNQIGYKNPRSVAITNTGSPTNFDVYLALYGYGVYKRSFCGNDWCNTTILFDDAEDLQGWTVYRLWDIDQCRKHSGDYSFKAGAHDYPICSADYPANDTGFLMYNNWIDLGPPGHNFLLTFWEYVDTEQNWDFCKVQISSDGTNWYNLAEYSGFFGWHQRIIPLKDYSGLVKIRFVFSSDNIYEYEGWYIDDIKIFEGWRQLNPPNPYITDLYFYNYSSNQYLFATSENYPKPPQTPVYYGNIHRYSNSEWVPVGTSGIDYLSIDGPPMGYTGYILSGTAGEGVFYTQDAENFLRWCGITSPPPGAFVSVSVDANRIEEGPFAALTQNEFFRLDPSCPSGDEYLRYPNANFHGRGKSVLADCYFPTGGYYVGTEGLGLFKLDCIEYLARAIPLGNEGQWGGYNYLPSKNITKIAISDSPQVFFASSLSDGLYKSMPPFSGDRYFTRYFYDTEAIGTVPGTCVAIPKNYYEYGKISDKNLYVFLGTDKKGVYRSIDGGATWQKLLNSPQGVKIVDIVISPNFLNDSTLFLLAENGIVYASYNSGDSWTSIFDFGASIVKGYDLEISPSFSEDCTLFLATSLGLYKYVCAEWESVFPLSPVLSVTLSPLFNNNYNDTELERKTCIIGTDRNGIWYSFEKGNNTTFQRLQDIDYPEFNFSSVPIIKLHPASDVGSVQDHILYSLFVSNNPDGLWSAEFVVTGQNEGYWDVLNVAWQGIYDFRISDIAFNPDFRRDYILDIYLGHSNKKIYRGLYNFWDWQVQGGFYHTPQYIMSISEAPDMPEFIVAGTKDYGPMFSMDYGLTYYPFGSLKYDDYVIHDVPSVSITHPFEGVRRIIMSSRDLYSDCFWPHLGLYYGDFSNFSTIPNWQRSYLCLPPSNCSSPPTNYSQDNFNGHLIKEIRYTNLATDIEAADHILGPIMSDPAQGGAYGKYWQVDLGGDTPESLSDLSYPMSLGPGRGSKGAWVWGASGLSSGTLRASTPGAYKWTETEGWSLRNGSGSYSLPFADWRAIWTISENEVLIGSGMADGNGIYKTEDGGQKWVQANRGLEYASKIVKAFTGNSNYIFVALEEVGPILRSGSGSNNGGIYMSDCQSKGYAWVYYSEGLSCNSTYELSAGSRIYTGSTCDGIYGFEGDVHISGYPVAMFSFERNNPWNEREVQFIDRSAGLCTENCATCPDVTWTWICNDGFFSNIQNPSFIFSSGGTFSCYLYVVRGWEGDSYYTDITIPEVTTLMVEKSGSDIKVSWQRLAGDETLVYKYKVYRDTSPQGTGILLLQTIAPQDRTYCDTTSCWYIDKGTSAGNYYYRVFTE